MAAPGEAVVLYVRMFQVLRNTYRPIQCTSDRLRGVEVTWSHGPTLSVFGVYLPYDDHCLLTHEYYLECMNEFQGLIENCESGPCMALGDSNRGFSPRSAVLYDFCRDSDMCVMNFALTIIMTFVPPNRPP